MKAEWTNYLTSIGITDAFLKRVESILGFYQQAHPNAVQDIFVSGYVDKDGNRNYESLWLFSDTSVMEAKDFLNKDDFDCGHLKQRVDLWTIKKENYDFHKASPNSRMMVNFRLATGVAGGIKASGLDCDSLKTIFLKYISPNEIRGSAKPKDE